MTFQEEWENLKQEFSKKAELIYKKYKDDSRDKGLDGISCYEVDKVWKSEFLPKLNELKKKYKIK